GAIAQRERPGDEGTGGGTADEVEPVAEPHRMTQAIAQDLFDSLEKGDGDSAAHPAAIEGENALGPRREEMAIPSAAEGSSSLHQFFRARGAARFMNFRLQMIELFWTRNTRTAPPVSSGSCAARCRRRPRGVCLRRARWRSRASRRRRAPDRTGAYRGC